MTRGALILTYHSVSDGPPPLCIEPARFRKHLDTLADERATTLTVTELAEALTGREVPERAVAITFDDGYADFVETAAPLLAERGLRATVFCIAGYLGEVSDWPTLPARAPRVPLASAEQLAEAGAAGFEIGSHGVEHAPLHRADEEESVRELTESRLLLEEIAGVAVSSFAHPYGLTPSPVARRVLEREYAVACAGGLRRVRESDDSLALPRVDAHYLRDARLLGHAVRGGAAAYLAARRAGARVRRLAFADHGRDPGPRR